MGLCTPCLVSIPSPPPVLERNLSPSSTLTCALAGPLYHGVRDHSPRVSHLIVLLPLYRGPRAVPWFVCFFSPHFLVLCTLSETAGPVQFKMPLCFPYPFKFPDKGPFSHDLPPRCSVTRTCRGPQVCVSDGPCSSSVDSLFPFTCGLPLTCKK